MALNDKTIYAIRHPATAFDVIICKDLRFTRGWGSDSLCRSVL